LPLLEGEELDHLGVVCGFCHSVAEHTVENCLENVSEIGLDPLHVGAEDGEVEIEMVYLDLLVLLLLQFEGKETENSRDH